MATIGFIGLGHMGAPMVRNLLNANHVVKVYDVMPQSVAQLKQEGAIAVEFPGQVAIDSDAVFTMVQTTEQVNAICLGEQGIFAHINKNAIYIDCSSIDMSGSRELHTIAQEKNISMVDAPVSGGVAGATAATLTIMVGGTQDNFNKAKPFLELLGKRIVHTGEAGHGQAAKICNNMMLAIEMIAVAEGFTLAESLGLAPEKLFEVASHASSQCWSMTSYCPVKGIIDNVPSNNDFKPGFTAKMMLKDLQLSQDAARKTSVATPLGAQATELYTLFNNLGNAEMDFSGIIQLIGGKK